VVESLVYQRALLIFSAFFIPFGQVVASGIGAGMANVPNAWRILFGLGVVPSVIQLGLMHWLPESPRVLIMRGQEDKALAILRKIYRSAPEEIIQLKLLVARNNVEASTQMQRSMSFWQRTKILWTHKPYRRPIITVSGLNMFTQLTGFNVFLYYSGTLFGLLGFDQSAPVGLIPSGINALFVVSTCTEDMKSCAESTVHRDVCGRSSGSPTSRIDRSAYHGHRSTLGCHFRPL